VPLPPLSGRPIRVELRRSLGPHLAATSIPRRLILIDSQTLREPGDFERILVHEIFHFAWRRLSNETRWNWEDMLRSELHAHATGELGWSAEWRKNKLKIKLTRMDPTRGTLDSRRKPGVARTPALGRTPAWRRYACESFCDSAAWLFSGLRDHDEFTLAPRLRRLRAQWFHRHLPGPIRI
jgi:hypothetical protein